MITIYAVRTLSILGIAVLFGFNDTLAAKYSCEDPPDKKAKLGISDKAAVTVKQDNSEKSCSFSVNGVSAGSPSQDEIFTSIRTLENVFVRSNIGQSLSSFPTDALANVLFAAGEIGEISDLRVSLRQRRVENRFRDCIKSGFRDQTTRGLGWFGAGRFEFTCGVFTASPRGEEREFAPFDGLGIVQQFDYLFFAARRSSTGTVSLIWPLPQ